MFTLPPCSVTTLQELCQKPIFEQQACANLKACITSTNLLSASPKFGVCIHFQWKQESHQ